MKWEEIEQDRQELIIAAEIYSVLTESPSYWLKKGFLSKVKIIDGNGKESSKYSVTEEGHKNLYAIAQKRVIKRFLKEERQEQRTNIIQKIKKGLEINLFNFMDKEEVANA